MEHPFSPFSSASVAVSQRLAANPVASRMPVPGIELYVVRDFLSAEDCAGIIALIDGKAVPSTLMQEEADKEFRTSSTCHMDRREPLVRKVESRITALTGIDPRCGETMQGQRYAVGQQFKPHNDYFHTHMPYWEETRKRGGQRTWTAMVCLNDVEAGGQTNFPWSACASSRVAATRSCGTTSIRRTIPIR